MSTMQTVLYGATGAGVLTVFYSLWLVTWINKQAKGDAKMIEISEQQTRDTLNELWEE